MSTRVKKAVGYGLPVELFYAHLLLPVDREECLGDELERLLDNTRHLMYGGDDTVSRVVDAGVISTHHPVSNLIMEVGDYDDVDHIIMFPSQKIKDDWFRFDDTIDYTFRVAASGEEPPQGEVKYLERGIHPFDDERMDRNGVQVKCGRDDNLWDFYKDPALIAGVPDTLRWWLLHCGVFSLTGVAAMRPMMAEWWG